MTQKRKRVFWTKEYDAERAALKRAKKAGFASIEEHRAAMPSRAAKRAADAAIRQETRAAARIERMTLTPAAGSADRFMQAHFGTPESVAPLPAVAIELVLDPPAPAPAAPATGKKIRIPPRVVDGRIVPGYWKIATPAELEEAAGRRELDRNAFRGNCQAGPQLGSPVFWEGATRDTKARDDMATDNERRYF